MHANELSQINCSRKRRLTRSLAARKFNEGSVNKRLEGTRASLPRNVITVITWACINVLLSRGIPREKRTECVRVHRRIARARECIPILDGAKGGRIAPLHSGHCGSTVLCEQYERKRNKDVCKSRFALGAIHIAVPASRDKHTCSVNEWEMIVCCLRLISTDTGDLPRENIITWKTLMGLNITIILLY